MPCKPSLNPSRSAANFLAPAACATSGAAICARATRRRDGESKPGTPPSPAGPPSTPLRRNAPPASIRRSSELADKPPRSNDRRAKTRQQDRGRHVKNPLQHIHAKHPRNRKGVLSPRSGRDESAHLPGPEEKCTRIPPAWRYRRSRNVSRPIDRQNRTQRSARSRVANINRHKREKQQREGARGAAIPRPCSSEILPAQLNCEIYRGKSQRPGVREQRLGSAIFAASV